MKETIIVVIAIVVIVSLAVLKMKKDKKKGIMPGGCAGCAYKHKDGSCSCDD